MAGATGGEHGNDGRGREGDLRFGGGLAPRNQAEPMTRFSSINVDKRRPPREFKERPAPRRSRYGTFNRRKIQSTLTEDNR